MNTPRSQQCGWFGWFTCGRCRSSGALSWWCNHRLQGTFRKHSLLPLRVLRPHSHRCGAIASSEGREGIPQGSHKTCSERAFPPVQQPRPQQQAGQLQLAPPRHRQVGPVVNLSCLISYIFLLSTCPATASASASTSCWTSAPWTWWNFCCSGMDGRL